MQIFGVVLLSSYKKKKKKEKKEKEKKPKLELNDEKRRNMRWRANSLICFGVSSVGWLEESKCLDLGSASSKHRT